MRCWWPGSTAVVCSDMSRLLHARRAGLAFLARMVEHPSEPTDPRREERRCAGQHRHHGMPEQEHDHEVEAGGETQREGEALHRPDADEVEHDRGEDRDGVRRDDRPSRPDPGPRHRTSWTAALTYLVFQ